MSGIRVDARFCTGCRACEQACRQELDLGGLRRGVVVVQHGPRLHADGTFSLDYELRFTPSCHGCAPRVARGLPPACVAHCPSRCLYRVEGSEE